MIGAILGDIMGSTYEFHNTFNYDFELFPVGSSYTDDTICTIAVADAILKQIPYRDSLLNWCRRYPHPMGCYGGSFSRWLASDNPQPYNSFGNGAAMRVSPVGWAFSIDPFKLDGEVISEARKSAECSHNHPEGIRGACAVARIIRILKERPELPVAQKREAVWNNWRDFYGSSVADLPKRGVFDETCQGCVPLAHYIVYHSHNFEQAIRHAISYGGDSDTLGAIVGGIAEAAFGVPKVLADRAIGYLPQEMKDVVTQFEKQYSNNILL